MSTKAALLRAIRAQPDEDTPRLVYADYLDEESDPARAEFIRVQVERARLPEGDPARAALEDREHDLLAQHEDAWLGVAPDDRDELAEWEFDRGFIHEVAASPAFMRTAGTDLCAAHPVRRWRVMSGDTGTNFPADLREAGQRGWFPRLEAVDLTGWYADLGETDGFLTRSNFERLRELDLTGRGPLGSLPEILEVAAFRDQLKVLRCGAAGYEGGRLDPADFIKAMGPVCRLEEFAAPTAQLMADDLHELLTAPVFAELKSLDLSGNNIEAEGGRAFRAPSFRLRELDISGTQLGGVLEELLGCAALGELRSLHLNRCGNNGLNLHALAGSRFWAQAEELRMQQGLGFNADYEEAEAPQQAEPPNLDPLFAATVPSNLHVLDIAGNGLRDAGVARLCAALWAGSLTYLDPSQNYLSDEALRTIAASGKFKNLHTLHLNFNSVYEQSGAAQHESITDAGLRALAECPDLANLRVLSVSGTRITADGVSAVLNSPHWRLSALRLAGCQLRRNVLDVLTTSPGLARLQVLDLSGNGDHIDVDDLAPLAECEYLSAQTELDIRGLNVGTGMVRSELSRRLGRRLSE